MPKSSNRDRQIRALFARAAITHEPLPEDIAPEDSFQFPEDIATCYELSERTPWGWCCVKTTATIQGPDGQQWSGSTYLGGCCYESEANFVQCTGEQQAMEACAALLDSIEHAIARGHIAARVKRGLLNLPRRM